MNEFFPELLDLSHHFGGDKRYVVAGGGNISLKDESYLYIKGSGFALATIKIEEFAILIRKNIDNLLAEKYDSDSQTREAQVKEKILACRADITSNVRPSVETPFHHLLGYRFVVHTHPNWVNALCCSQKNREYWELLFTQDSIFIPYVDPGYILAKTIEKELNLYRQRFSADPHCIFLENHGVIVGADTSQEIYEIYDRIFKKIQSQIPKYFEIQGLSIDQTVNLYIHSLKNQMDQPNSVVRTVNNTLIQYFLSDITKYKDISLPFNPDTIVYCKASPLILQKKSQVSEIDTEIEQKLKSYVKEWGYYPKIILIPEIGICSLNESQKSADNAADMFLDSLFIAYYSQYFGGPKGMSHRDIYFIDNWEVEKFRRSVAK